MCVARSHVGIIGKRLGAKNFWGGTGEDKRNEKGLSYELRGVPAGIFLPIIFLPKSGAGTFDMPPS